MSAAIDLSAMQGDYPLANTEATRMLAAALEKVNEEKGWSGRQVAKLLNYKSSVALSHMAIGRVPIPIDRVLDFCRLLNIDPGEFLIAVIEQRHPEINVRRMLGPLSKGSQKGKTPESILMTELEAIAGRQLDELPVQTINILREAVGDRNATRRWMATGEIPIIEHLRRVHPDGLTPAQVKKLYGAIDNL